MLKASLLCSTLFLQLSMKQKVSTEEVFFDTNSAVLSECFLCPIKNIFRDLLKDFFQKI